MKHIIITLCLLGTQVSANPFHGDPDNIEMDYSLTELVPEDNCVRYTNYFQPSSPDDNTVTLTLEEYGDIIFKFNRGPRKEPDTVMVWDLPISIASDVDSLTLEEDATGLICFRRYDGS